MRFSAAVTAAFFVAVERLSFDDVSFVFPRVSFNMGLSLHSGEIHAPWL